jgi:hypothetical protein
MDFESLVNFIVEEEDKPIDPTKEIDKNTIEAFIKDNLQEIKTEYEKKYGSVQGGVYLSESNLQQLAYLAMEKCKRTTFESSFYKPFDYVFPLLDLFGFLTRLFIKGSDATPEDKQAVLDNFLKNLNNTPSKVPLDYKPMNAWAMRVKEHYFSKSKTEDTLGSLRLDDIVKKFPNLSFYWLVLELAAFYMKGKTAKFPSKYNNVIQIGNTKVTEILTKIINFKGGTQQFNEPALIEAYGNSFFDRILRVSMDLYQLYRQQAAQALGKNSDLDDNVAVYQQFIGVEQKTGAVPFIWGKYEKPGIKESFNYKYTFETFWENIMNQVTDSNLILESGWFELGDGKVVMIDDQDPTQTYIKYVVVDKKDRTKPDPNYEPVILNPKDFQDIYDNNEQVRKEIDVYVQKQKNKNPKDKKVLFTYFSKASGPNNTEEQAIDNAVRSKLQQRIKDQLLKRAAGLKGKVPTSDPTASQSIFYLKDKMGNDIKETQFLYNCTKLKEAKDGGDPLSSTLWKSLESFASYIQTAEKNDWADDVRAGVSALATAAKSGELRSV